MGKTASQNERFLVRRARKEPEAFSKLYNLYFQRIFSYVSWRVGDQRDAEDLVSDIFTRVLDNLNAFEWKKNASFSSWIFRIAHNAVVDHYRKTGSKEFVSIDNLPEIAANELLPDTLAERRQLFRSIFEQIQKLPARQAEIITMRFFGEMRNKEIAEVLEIEEKSVSSSLFRGLKGLRDRMKVAGLFQQPE